MAVSKRLRYEVLRRDNYACRYCGGSAPEVRLTVDHVTPLALGGTDEPGNLVTACTDCNGGKSSSSPDQPLVEDVSADALRWGRAMQAAAEVLLADHDLRAERRDMFSAAWHDWKYNFGTETFPLPDNWEQSVDTIVAAGLPIEVLCECIDKAMRARHVQAGQVFRYMCGIAWKKIGELREIAGQLLDAEGPADTSGSIGAIAAAREEARARGAGPPPPGLILRPGRDS